METAKLNNLKPEAYLRDVLGRIAEHAASKLNELLLGTGSRKRQQQRPPERYRANYRAVTVDDICRVELARDPDGQALPRELVDHVERAVSAAVVAAILDEVV